MLSVCRTHLMQKAQYFKQLNKGTRNILCMEKVRSVLILYRTLYPIYISGLSPGKIIINAAGKMRALAFFRGFRRKRSAQVCSAKPENHIFSPAYLLYNARIRQSVLWISILCVLLKLVGSKAWCVWSFTANGTFFIFINPILLHWQMALEKIMIQSPSSNIFRMRMLSLKILWNSIYLIVSPDCNYYLLILVRAPCCRIEKILVAVGRYSFGKYCSWDCILIFFKLRDWILKSYETFACDLWNF